MALFKTLFGALARLFCAYSAQEHAPPEEELTPPPVAPHEPNHRQGQHDTESDDEEIEELYCLSVGLPERQQPRPWGFQRAVRAYPLLPPRI